MIFLSCYLMQLFNLGKFRGGYFEKCIIQIIVSELLKIEFRIF